MTDHQSKLSDRELLFRFWRYVRPYKGALFLSLFLVFTTSALGLVQPLLVKKAIDSFIATKQTHMLFYICALLLFAIGLEFSCRSFQMYLLQKMGEATLRDLRNHLYQHLQKLGSSFFTREPVGRLVVRSTTDVESLSEMFTAGIISIVADCFMLIGIVAMLFYLSASMTLSSFIVVPVLVTIAIYFRKKMREAFRNIRKYLGLLNAYLAEHLNGMAIVQAFNQENNVFKEFDKSNSKLMKLHFQNITYDATLYSIVEALGSVTIGLILWFVSGSLVQEIITAGTLVAFIEYIQRFFIPIRDLSQKYSIMQSGFTALERIFGLLDNNDMITESPEALTPSKIQGQVEFKNVSFAYREGETVLNNISLKIHPGEKVAFVGPTGGGKTTIMKLATRLYDIEEGQILLDGIDIRNLNLSFLRKSIGIVSQDFFIFSGAISENVSLGDPAISQAKIIEACKAVGIHEFILSLSNGYQTKLAEKGANISVGQRQLISFARAFAFNPPVLILDEATSNIDTHTELLIQAALDKLTQDRTSLIIAHRLSTIKNADRIIVINKGQILEEGSHASLLEGKGLYHKLYTLQFHPII